MFLVEIVFVEMMGWVCEERLVGSCQRPGMEEGPVLNLVTPCPFFCLCCDSPNTGNQHFFLGVERCLCLGVAFLGAYGVIGCIDKHHMSFVVHLIGILRRSGGNAAIFVQWHAIPT